MDDRNTDVSKVARKMLKKLNTYALYINNPLCNLTYILDPMFWNDIISENNLLRDLVPLLVKLFYFLSDEWVHVREKNFSTAFVGEDSR